MPWSPSALNTCQAIPGCPLTWLPTTAMMATCSWLRTRSISPRSNSSCSSRSRLATTAGASAERTSRQIFCSDEDWVNMRVLAPLRATAENTRPATPGTPCMPWPSMVTMLRSRMAVMPFTGGVSETSPQINVPGWSGFIELSTRTGMFRLATG